MSEVQVFLDKHKDKNGSLSSEQKEQELIEQLQDEIQKEQDERHEERFLWVCSEILLLDIGVENSGIGLSWYIYLFEFIFLIWLSNYLGIERIYLFLMQLYEDLRKKFLAQKKED